jgi:hypothetical protein
MTFTLLFLGFAALSGLITLILIVACALDAAPSRASFANPMCCSTAATSLWILSRGYFN